jgi:hypothetical protein
MIEVEYIAGKKLKKNNLTPTVGAAEYNLCFHDYGNQVDGRHY